MAIHLRDYQLDAITRMKNGCILNGGVGSGKSRTTIAYYYLQNGGDYDSLVGMKYKRMENPMDLYIITTARKRDTFEWEDELTPFLMNTDPSLSVYKKQKITIDSWNNLRKYRDVDNAFFIFDEQRVVGNGTWVKAFLKIVRHNKWVLLSATPGDTWQDYIPVFIANRFYKNRTEFNTEHIIYSRFSKYPKIDRYINTNRLIRLRDSILITMDFQRETISHHENIYVDYNRELYKGVMKNRWNFYENRPIENAAELCYILRKICNSDISRQIALLQRVENHPKVIIFYNFDYELEILRELFLDLDFEVAEWNGHKHQPIPEGKKWVYLVQYNAGAEGWNCIKTDTIIFFSQNYSYKMLEQASGRIDRLNTPFVDLYYYHLQSTSNIDLAIRNALKNKKNFNEGKFVNTRK